jgi:HEPN domain-containing protein
MKPETQRYLHEARVARDSAAKGFTDVSSMNAPGAGSLFTAVELGIKSVIVEKHGDVPGKYHSHRIIDVAKEIKLWDQLPPDLETCVTELSEFDPNTRYPGTRAHETLVGSTTFAQWERRLKDGERFLDFVEQVINDPAGFPRLTP